MIFPGTARACIDPGGLCDPRFGNDTATVPLAFVQVEPAELGEVPRGSSEATAGLLQPIWRMIDAPRSLILHAEGVPDALLHVLGDALLAESAMECKGQQEGIAGFVEKPAAWRLMQPEFQDLLFESVCVVEAGMQPEGKVVLRIIDAGGHL